MKSITPNNREIIAARSTITDEAEYLESTNHALNVVASFTPGITQDVNLTKIAGNSIATAASGIAKVGLTDGTGNAITSTAGALDVNATFSGTVTSSPTFAQNPGAGTPTPAYGLVDSSFRPQVSIATALPAGSNVIGHVITDTGSTTAVTGTVTISGAVTGSGNFTVVQPTGTNLHTVIDSGTVAATQSGAWNITNISGTVSLPTGAATAALQTQPGVDIGDVTVNNASGASAVNIQDGGNSITVDGTVGVTQATAASLNATVVGTGTFAVQSTTAAPTTIYNGKKTVTTAGTRVTLAASQAVKSVTIKALSTNTGVIYVGDASVASTTGLQLLANETVSMDIANLNTVNLDSSVSLDGVTYLGVG